MKYASVCSGIEAATVAWHPLGWTPVWFSQFDPEHNYAKGPDFPSAVLAHHYPSVPNLGNMLELRNHKIYHDEQFNILVGGTPCQGFSIAGLRGGLRDERSNLSLEFIRILDNKRPDWFVWENVPGVITTGAGSEDENEQEDGGASSSDFAQLLSAFTGREIATQEFEKAGVIEGEFYSIAWRILDSKYFGVPQRRRRIFVVGHIGKDWRPPVAVLFEQDSLRRDFTPGGKKRKGSAKNTKPGTASNSCGGGIDKEASAIM
jgi:DNA (cytosine-5)-methyltransferase 1